ncbi:hypothetical protein PAMP_003379 [Pampus punctatissimus]
MKLVQRLETFTRALDGSSRANEVNIRGLFVFRYSLEEVINSENPDLFVKSLIYRQVPVTKTHIDKILCDLKSKHRTQALVSLLNNGRYRFSSNEDLLYEGLSFVIDEKMSNSSLCLSHSLTEIHSKEPGALASVKVYDHTLVRYLFDSLQVGRLFQSSTTFNYIIINTVPRYTIERAMLFNITGL